MHETRAHLDAQRDNLLQRAGIACCIPAALVTSNLEAAVSLMREALAT